VKTACGDELELHSVAFGDVEQGRRGRSLRAHSGVFGVVGVSEAFRLLADFFHGISGCKPYEEGYIHTLETFSFKVLAPDMLRKP